MAKDKRTIWTLPTRWGLPFLAAWRTFEKTINPAFVFIIRCANCGASGKDRVRFVKSVKTPSAVIGIECNSCKQTLKFEDGIDSEAPDFPDRLRGPRADSILEPPNKPGFEDALPDLDELDDITDLLL